VYCLVREIRQNSTPTTSRVNVSNVARHDTHCFSAYGVATISRLLKIIGLFCKRALYKRLYSAKETYNVKEPTNRSHPIVHLLSRQIHWMSQMWRDMRLTRHESCLVRDRTVCSCTTHSQDCAPRVSVNVSVSQCGETCHRPRHWEATSHGVTCKRVMSRRSGTYVTWFIKASV